MHAALAERPPIPRTQSKPSYDVDHNAFALEYAPNKAESALYKDIESYLGEYRFNIPKYEYRLNFTTDSNDQRQLRDNEEGLSMAQICQNSIDRKLILGKNIQREKAELTGIEKIDHILTTSSQGETLVWLSPPGSKEDGYGDYGFCFVGEVQDSHTNSGDKSLSMTAIRVEKPSLDQYNRFINILQSSDTPVQSPEQLLANPTMLRGVTKAHIYSLMPEIFNFKIDNKKEAKFRESMNRLQPYIMEFINMVKSGVPRAELRRAFNAIEVYSEQLRNGYSTSFDTEINNTYQTRTMSFNQLLLMYGDKKATPVAGSCGSNGKTSNVFNKYSSLSSIMQDALNKRDYNFEKEGKCLVCGSDPTKLGPCDICQHCDDQIREQAEQPLPFSL